MRAARTTNTESNMGLGQMSLRGFKTSMMTTTMTLSLTPTTVFILLLNMNTLVDAVGRAELEMPRAVSDRPTAQDSWPSGLVTNAVFDKLPSTWHQTISCRHQ